MGHASELGPDPHARSMAELLGAYSRGAARVLPELIGVPWLPRSVLDRLVAERTRRIVAHAAANIPHYREAYAGLSQRELSDPGAFSALPFLEKRHLKEQGDTLLWPETDRNRLLERKSSGSTGSPVRVFFDPLAELPRRAQEVRMLTAHGVRPWHKQMILDAPAHLAPKPFLPQRLGLWRREPYPWWMSPEDALEYINREQPDVFHGVLAGIRMLALSADARSGLSYRPFRVVTKGELLDPATRWFIENALGAKVLDFYATEETGIIAWECPRGGGYHVDEDFVRVEIVRRDGTPAERGEVGEIVLTNLYQRAMPIIRYRVGDLGALAAEPCRCGRKLVLLQNLQGRKLDFIVTPDGVLRDPFRVMAVMEHVDHVHWYRVIQVAIDQLVVKIGWDGGAGDTERRASAAQITQKLKELLSDAMQVTIEDGGQFRVEIGEKAPIVKGLPGQELEALAERGYRLSF